MPSRSRPSAAAIRTERPDLVAIAGDLVLNGPDPAGAVDLLREMEADGAAIVSGNTDIAVADFDYAAAFPWMTDGVPDTFRAAAEWAHDALGDERIGWLRRLPVRAPAARRRRHDDPRLPRLARLADRGLRPGARPERHHRARGADRRPGHRLRPHPPARDPRPRLEAHRQRRLGRLRLRRRPDRLVGAHRRRRTARSGPRSSAPSSTCSRSPTRSPPAACRATSTARRPSEPGSWSGDRTVGGDGSS